MRGLQAVWWVPSLDLVTGPVVCYSLAAAGEIGLYSAMSQTHRFYNLSLGLIWLFGTEIWIASNMAIICPGVTGKSAWNMWKRGISSPQRYHSHLYPSSANQSKIVVPISSINKWAFICQTIGWVPFPHSGTKSSDAWMRHEARPSVGPGVHIPGCLMAPGHQLYLIWLLGQ